MLVVLCVMSIVVVGVYVCSCVSVVVLLSLGNSLCRFLLEILI